MELSKDEKYDRLGEKVIKLGKSILLENLENVIDLTKNITSFLNDDDITGFERVSNIGIESESSGQETNPLLWELGHICYFYDYHCLKNLLNNHKIVIKDGYIYDSFQTNRDVRYSFKEHSKDLLFEYLEYVGYSLKEYLKNNLQVNERITYLIMLVILHNHMHLESFIFSQKLLGYSNPIDKSFTSNNSILNYEWIKIKGGSFYQGTFEGEYDISFDNEMPAFKKEVKDFYVLNMLVNEDMLLNFVLEGGYSNEKLWSVNGNNWRKSKNIKLPMYWFYKKDKYYIKEFNNYREINKNLPACHISWYEAEAICKWLGGRLPTEAEWEYMATNAGETKYPWGSDMEKNKGNLNYSGGLCNVDKYINSANDDGVIQLIGNVWEWCQNPIHPYDGYRIDPIYREFSYPFFGFKKILKGGSWAVPDILINPRYRNAQLPDMRMQFTGVRVVK